MTATIRTDDWFEYLDRDYLSSYVSEGGASVKFAVPMDAASRQTLDNRLQALSESYGYLYLSADDSVIRIHMIDALYFGLSWQVPWQALCRRVVIDLAASNSYRVSEAAAGSTQPLAEVIAQENDSDVDWVKKELRSELQRRVFRDSTLVRDFRVAMMILCNAELTGGPEGENNVQVVTDWITGVNNKVSAVRPYGIQSRIHRTNARYFLESTLTWIRRAGRPGTIIRLNMEAVTEPRRIAAGGVYYTKAAVLDAYEVLRQFIDDMDNLDGCLLVVVPGLDFLEIDPPTRGMGCYEALKFRVYDEIRDRDLVNPLASLVRLGEAIQ